MLHPELGIFLSVISTGRAHAVPSMHAMLGPEVSWYVREGEEAEYAAAGARHIHATAGLCEARNAALTDAWAQGVPCVQLSDDLKGIKAITDTCHGASSPRPISWQETIEMILDALWSTSASLGGVAPTANPLNYNPSYPVRTSHFIVGDCMVIKPCTLWFDTTLALKEDYDYTLQHLAQFGVVARCDHILATFRHRTNTGGAVAYRNATMEDETIRQLKAKWGEVIVDHPRRPHEILLKWHKPQQLL